MMLVIRRVWKRDGVARVITLADAVAWAYRNQRPANGAPRLTYDEVEAALGAGRTLETPCALLGALATATRGADADGWVRR